MLYLARLIYKYVIKHLFGTMIEDEHIALVRKLAAERDKAVDERIKKSYDVWRFETELRIANNKLKAIEEQEEKAKKVTPYINYDSIKIIQIKLEGEVITIAYTQKDLAEVSELYFPGDKEMFDQIVTIWTSEKNSRTV